MSGDNQKILLQKDGKNIKNMFSSIARFYDLLNRVLSFRFDQKWRRLAVAASDAPPDGMVLDVCCGTGDLSIAYAKALGRGGTVTGSDFCHEMLRYGNIKTSKMGIRHKISFTEADTLNLPFRSGQFQITAVAFGIRNVARLENGISEMARVTTSGGRVVILEFSQPTNPIFNRIYFFYFTKILPKIGNLISSSEESAYTYLPNSVISFPDRDSLRSKMEDCGLTDVVIHSLTFGIVTIHVGTKA